MPDILFIVGLLYPFSQLRTLAASHPIIFATSFCRRPKSSRHLRSESPRVLTSFGYALSLGFFPVKRTRQKSNATSGAHCHREHEVAKEKLISHGLNLRTFLTLIRFVKVAPLQLGEEGPVFHRGSPEKMRVISFLKRGSPRSESRR